MRLPPALLVLPVLAAVTAAARAPSPARPQVGDTTVFAALGAPGHPDTSIVLTGGDIAVSTNRGAHGAEPAAGDRSGAVQLFRVPKGGGGA